MENDYIILTNYINTAHGKLTEKELRFLVNVAANMKKQEGHSSNEKEVSEKVLFDDLKTLTNYINAGAKTSINEKRLEQVKEIYNSIISKKADLNGISYELDLLYFECTREIRLNSKVLSKIKSKTKGEGICQ